MIACPVCCGDRVSAHDAPYGEPGIMDATCERCGKSFDVRVTAEGVELAPCIYHGPESAWMGRPDGHRPWEPCVLCDVEDLADDDADDLDPGGRDFRGAWDNPPTVPAVYHPELGYWHDAKAPCDLCDGA